MKALSCFLSLIFLFSCAQPAPPPKPDPGAQNAAIARSLFDHFNRHDWDKMAALYAENAEFKDPSLGKTAVTQTRAQTAAKYRELQAIFPDIHDEVVAVYPSGDKNVIVEFVSTGTAPDNSKLLLPICVVFTIENGLIVKDYTYYDQE